ncbi:MAG: CD1871A family CXXC motif-containing protein [Bacillota bacterium]|nr:CD1871A family CXXC motif-containing protein [Bacillota bacterium]
MNWRTGKIALLLALLALGVGAARGELALIYRNAVTLCLSCIGLAP